LANNLIIANKIQGRDWNNWATLQSWWSSN